MCTFFSLRSLLASSVTKSHARAQGGGIPVHGPHDAYNKKKIPKKAMVRIPCTHRDVNPSFNVRHGSCVSISVFLRNNHGANKYIKHGSVKYINIATSSAKSSANMPGYFPLDEIDERKKAKGENERAGIKRQQRLDE